MNQRGAKVRLSRQLGIALTPKARKFMERRPYPPGQHGPGQQKGVKWSDYKRHLMEKQRLRAHYNLEEKQMRKYAREAMQERGNPVDNLIKILEVRLDAVVNHAGLARTIYAAQQLISHGHFLVNGKGVNIRSHRLRVGDVVSVKEASLRIRPFIEAAEEMVAKPTLAYLNSSKEEMSAKLVHLPNVE